jgi:hypothetical protein
LKTRISFISKPTGVTNSHGSALILPWRMSLNLMGNEHTAKAHELRQERKARQTQKLVDPRSNDKVTTH